MYLYMCSIYFRQFVDSFKINKKLCSHSQEPAPGENSRSRPKTGRLRNPVTNNPTYTVRKVLADFAVDDG